VRSAEWDEVVTLADTRSSLRDGWGLSKIKKPRKPIKTSKEREDGRRARAYEKRLSEYARICGIAEFEGRSFPSVPEEISNYLSAKETQISATDFDIISLVKNHPNFFLDEKIKAPLINRREWRAQKQMSDFVKQWAKCHFQGKAAPQPNDHLLNLLSEEERSVSMTSGTRQQPGCCNAPVISASPSNTSAMPTSKQR